MNEHLLWIGAAIAVLLLLWVLLHRRPPVYVRGDFLTVNERPFYDVLYEAVANDYQIHCKVRLADLIKANPDLPAKERMRAFNKVRSKHVDFTLCDHGEPVLVIELDDRSHERPDRIERDAFVDNALKRAGLPILHIKTADSYDAKALTKLVHGAAN
jgi:hypothetical protein